MFSGVTHRLNHPFHAPGTEPSRDHYSTDGGQVRFWPIPLNIFGMYPLEIDVSSVVQAGMPQGFPDLYIGFGVFNVFTHQGYQYTFFGFVHAVDHCRPFS